MHEPTLSSDRAPRRRLSAVLTRGDETRNARASALSSQTVNARANRAQNLTEPTPVARYAWMFCTKNTRRGDALLSVPWNSDARSCSEKAGYAGYAGWGNGIASSSPFQKPEPKWPNTNPAALPDAGDAVHSREESTHEAGKSINPSS
jgi:hypothetical protein